MSVLVVALLSNACASGARGSASGSSRVVAGSAGPAWQDVRASGLRFQVPSGWPVYVLAADPTRCVRLDVRAVYIGRQGSSAVCPAHASGRTETVEVESADATTATTSPAPASVTHAIVQTFPAAHAVVTVTFGSDESLARTIAASVRVG